MFADRSCAHNAATPGNRESTDRRIGRQRRRIGLTQTGQTLPVTARADPSGTACSYPHGDSRVGVSDRGSRRGFVVVRFLDGLSAGSGCNDHDFSDIPLGMAHRVGPKGQVVIPKAMRDRLGIVPGDLVDFALEDDAVRVEPVRARSSLRGTLAGIGLTAVLEADHRMEQDR